MLAFRIVRRGALVEEVGAVAEDREAMGEAGRNPQLVMVVAAEHGAGPLAEGRRAAPDVDGNVEYLPGGYGDQLPLAVRRLVRQAADPPTETARDIGLHGGSAAARV